MSLFSTSIRLTGVAILLGCALPAFADEATIPVIVTLDGVRSGYAPLYISVQKRAHFMGIKGHSEILKTTTDGTMHVTVNVDTPDDYAVSVWHDLNDDGVFSMTDDYQVLDGWGNSGATDLRGRPTFDDVKFTVTDSGAATVVALKYPSE
ncbi:DUF2141 domain-containing protein [Robiginitomaculum antarcticum]|uniref:DUF2141 domain-containing protein n=1 Tax=Robiginitomaculum antarcticum TaxID=437507 RepID=UPI0003750A87|nr:DUF2141 domain-containing protein [Robiginitomaculum antarcticum]